MVELCRCAHDIVIYKFIFAYMSKIWYRVGENKARIKEVGMVGRNLERGKLLEAFESDHSEFVVVYGRRRVGKTFLVRETFNYKFTFQHTGHSTGRMQEQLLYFRESLIDAGFTDCPILKTWHEAFRHLQKFLETRTEQRKTVFIDELPFMATRKSGCVAALEHFWNGWATARKDIVLVVCGSAASWLLNKIIGDKGGLHNRVTKKIHLSPFSLSECEQMSKEMNLGYSRKQIAECYMAIGGIPYYWSCLRKGLSVQQNMDQLFFAEDAGLGTEYDELYRALFDSPEPYMRIVEALGRTGGAMTRDEIARKAKLSPCGTFTRYLDDLEKCGFIMRYRQFGADVRGALYRLIDNYTLFYFRFVAENIDGDPHFWKDSTEAPFRRAWTGLAYERLCLKHLPQIKAALGIAGVRTSISTWSHRADETYPEGAQIDLLIDRADGIINICEMKFCSGTFAIDKSYSKALANKVQAFRTVTGTKKGLHLTLVTLEGVMHNSYWNDVQSEVTLDDLFKE